MYACMNFRFVNVTNGVDLSVVKLVYLEDFWRYFTMSKADDLS